MQSYPIYILDLEQTAVVFPANKEDLGHCEFWEQMVHKMVADYYKVPPERLFNLPYCQRRGRVVGQRIYYGEKDDNNDLLQLIRRTVQDDMLVFYSDVHERRLKEDVREFRRLTALCQ